MMLGDFSHVVYDANAARAVAAVAVAAFAAVTDIRRRRVPNLLLPACVAAGLLFALFGCAAGGGAQPKLTVAGALLGAAAPFACLFWLWRLRALGAGDVKLLMALGALLGPLPALETALYAFVAGGVLALACALPRGAIFARLGGTLRHLWLCVLHGRLLPLPADPANPGIPFAAAVLPAVVVTCARMHGIMR